MLRRHVRCRQVGLEPDPEAAAAHGGRACWYATVVNVNRRSGRAMKRVFVTGVFRKRAA